MQIAHPHYLLFSSADPSTALATRWQFVLESLDGTSRLAASDEEPDAPSERAELLAVVRGLEALDQPSRVTLVTPSRYVARGIVRCLDDWRAGEWRWERFGRLEPIRDHDLWQRIDRALAYHRVDCHTWPTAQAGGETELAYLPRPEAEAVSSTPTDGPAVLVVRKPAQTRRRGILVRWAAACDTALGRASHFAAACLRCLTLAPRST